MINHAAQVAQVHWQQRVAACCSPEDWLAVQQDYEAAVQAGDSHRFTYWYLGLAHLLAGQEDAAQGVWLSAIAHTPDATEQATAELVTVLSAEARRQEHLRDYQGALLIRQYLRELAPQEVNNCLHLVQLSLNLRQFQAADLVELQLLDALLQGRAEINTYLLSRLVEQLNAYSLDQPPIPDFLQACKPYIQPYLRWSVERDPDKKLFQYSYLGEEQRIEYYLDQLGIETGYCVDIAASDGITMSNTYFLYDQGWSGLAVECDPIRFAQLATRYARFSAVGLSRGWVTPETVCALLQSHQAAHNFEVLNLDIDGFDYPVLEAILSSFRPRLICTEINTQIPPPLHFYWKWNPDRPSVARDCYGQSIAQVHHLCEQHHYALVELHYNNAFLIPREISPVPSLSAEAAYRRGYVERPDRQIKFPWNRDQESLLSLSPEAALEYVRQWFAQYEGQFVCHL